MGIRDVEIAKAQGRVVADIWLTDHKDDFQPCPENTALLGDWLRANGKELSYENLEAAFQAEKGKLKPVVPVDELALLAPVPPYMDRIRTSKDIRDLDPETFSKWRKGPDRDVFFKRLETIKQRGL